MQKLSNILFICTVELHTLCQQVINKEDIMQSVCIQLFHIFTVNLCLWFHRQDDELENQISDFRPTFSKQHILAQKKALLIANIVQQHTDKSLSVMLMLQRNFQNSHPRSQNGLIMPRTKQFWLSYLQILSNSYLTSP